MRSRVILVTGVGAVIGYGIIRSLRLFHEPITIIGTDIYADAAGQYFCDQFIPAVRADSPDYIDFLRDLIDRYGIDLVFFGTEQELFRVSDNRQHLVDYLGKLVINRKETIDLSKDKWETIQFLAKNKYPTIPSFINGDYDWLIAELGSPFLLKLRHSYASKGQVRITSPGDLAYWKMKTGSEFMVQKIIGDMDHEYTVSTFGLGGGAGLDPFILRRKLSGEGATSRAVVEENPELCQEVEKLNQLFQPLGPTNYQFRLHGGQYFLLEINPRISSATSIRAAFGYNEAVFCINHYLEGIVPVVPQLRKGSATRYISDWITTA